MTSSTALTQTELKSAIIRNPLTVSPDTTVMEAIAQMSGVRTLCSASQSADIQGHELSMEVRSSCVLVVEGRQLLGIVTERDIVRLTAKNCCLERMNITTVMASEVVTMRESVFTDLFVAVNLVQQHHIRHLPILDDENQLVGLVTHESLRKASRPIDLLRIRLVSEVMATEIICASADVSMLTIAQLMAQNRVSSVMIVEAQHTGGDRPQQQIPIGIVTERDLVQFQALNLNLETCQAHSVMSTPIFTVKPNDSLWDVQQIMEQRLVRRLAVTGVFGELLGIVTQTSILQVLNPLELYKLAEVLDNKVSKLEADKIALLENRTVELERQVEERTAALATTVRREKLMVTIASQIRSSLDLPEILDTAVKAVREFLQCDRLLIYRFEPDWTGVVVAESVEAIWRTSINDRINDSCFQERAEIIYQSGKTIFVDNIYTAGYTPCHVQLLEQYQVKSNLVVPILVSEKLWGLLIGHHCESYRAWYPNDLSLLEEIAVQLAIAIQQAELHSQLQEELAERRQTELLLRKSQENYRLITETIEDVFWLADPQLGRAIYISSGYEKIWGRAAEPLYENFLGWLEAVHPDDREYVSREFMQLLSTDHYEVDYRIVRPDGSVRWIRDRGFTIKDDSGTVVQISGVAEDISDRKANETFLRQYEGIVSATPDRIALVDRNYIYRLVNRTYLERSGKSWTEIVGHSVADLHGETMFQTIMKPYLDRCLGGESQQYEAWVYEFNGTEPRFISVSYGPYLSADGTISGVTVNARDLTELKLAEESLREKEQFLRSIYEGIEQAVFTVDVLPDGEFYFLEFNPACERLTQTLTADVRGKKPLPEIRERYADCVQAGFPICYEERLTFKGKITWWITTLTPIRDNGDRIYRIVGTSMNITERKQAEADLLQLNQSLEARVAQRTAELQEREAQLYDLFDNATDLIQSVSPLGQILFVNSAWKETLGYTDVDLQELFLFEIIHPDSWVNCQVMMEQLFDGVPCTSIELMFLTKDRRTIVVEGNVNCRLENGKPMAMRGIFRNITERKQAEARLKDTLKELSDFKYALDESAIVAMTNAEGKITYVNDRFCEIFQYSRGELIGNTYRLLNAGHHSPEFFEEMWRTLRNGEIWRGEILNRAKDGSFYWIDTTIVPYLDADGKPFQYLAIRNDISDRKRAQEQLSSLSDRLELALKSGQIGIWDWDIVNDRLIWDDRMYELYGVTASDFGGAYQAWEAAIHPDDILATRTVSEESRAGIRDFDTEFRVVWPDGTVKFIKAYALIQRNSQAEPQRMIGINYDISDRKQAEARLTETNQKLAISNQELARATRLKDEFLANMSHELRTPLNAILGMTEALQEHIFGSINEGQIRALQTIEHSGTHLLSLINDILDLAKIESGQIELNCSLTAIDNLCQSSLTLVKQQALQKRIQLQVKIPANLPELLVDERRIRQVLINLLNNAIKFTPEGGSVTLEVTIAQTEMVPTLPNSPTRSSSIRFAVSDTGIGITAENIQKLFQPFVQIDSALNRQYMGTGLGLSLVKRMVEKHGGTVSVTSEVGVGSCFSFDLPAGNLPMLISQSPIVAPSAPMDGHKESATSRLILLAEDNEANISTISGYLMAKGYRIVVAKNGGEAIAVTKSSLPDLILMDIQMPGMDGFEAIQQIRSDRQFAHIPIIALTALAMTGDGERCLEAGANNYLTKPVKLKQLANAIHELLATKELNQ
ncbi:MAG: PAS domain S-box protein [Microcoleus sp.]